jgi:hypothetical protein
MSTHKAIGKCARHGHVKEKTHQELALDILERLNANGNEVCMADLRDLRKIAGTWPG